MVRPWTSHRAQLLKAPLNSSINIWRCGPLVIEEIFGSHGHDLSVKLRHGADPSAILQLACRAPDKLHMWQTHVPGVVKHLAVFDHDEDCVAVAHSNLLAH